MGSQRVRNDWATFTFMEEGQRNQKKEDSRQSKKHLLRPWVKGRISLLEEQQRQAWLQWRQWGREWWPMKSERQQDTIAWKAWVSLSSVHFSSVAQSCPTLCDPMDCSMPGFPVHHQLLEFTQTHVHWVGDAIQPSHPLSSPSPPAFNLSQHQGLLKWISSLHQVAKVLDFQLQHQSLQWIFRADFL